MTKKKSIQERLTEVIQIRQKLNSLEMNKDSKSNGLQQLFCILSTFVKKGEFWQGRIILDGFQRIAIIKLFTTKNNPIQIKLSYDKTV